MLKLSSSNYLLCVSTVQRMQLDIILTSLQDHNHVASLLGFASTTDPGPPLLHRSLHSDTQLAEILMKTLLRNLGFHTVSLPFNHTESKLFPGC